MKYVLAAVGLSALLAACGTATSTESTATPTTPTPSVSETTAATIETVSAGEWTWTDQETVKFEVPPGASLTVNGAVDDGNIDDNQVAVFTGQDPVTITATGAGATTGTLTRGTDTLTFTIVVSSGGAGQAAESVVGMDENKAEKYVEKAGYVYRVVSVDGEDLPATMDYNPDRVNVTVQDGIVTGATTG